MNTFFQVTLADFRESVRAKWFLIYSLVFGGAVILLFVLGVTEARVMGFTGLSRLLITYIQLCVAILPILILISTVRSVVGDRESNILEYFLSMPLSLGAYFWGKILSRFFLIFIPISTALLGAIVWGIVRSLAIPWQIAGYYAILLGTLSWCFLGLGMVISTLVKKQEWGLEKVDDSARKKDRCGPGGIALTVLIGGGGSRQATRFPTIACGEDSWSLSGDKSIFNSSRWARAISRPAAM